MEALVAYYSRTGYTKKLAEDISSELGGESEEIIDMKDRSGVLGYLRSSWGAMRGKRPEIKEPEYDPTDFDVTIIGTPLWVQRPATPVVTYLDKYSKRFNKTAYFCTLGGSGEEKTFRRMEELAKEPLDTLSLTTNTVKEGDYQHEVKRFIDGLKV
ncbi:MAG: flavodoxin family protein [Thermoplasmata archaeon]